MRKRLIRALILAVSFAGLGLGWSVSPAAAQEPSKTIALCAVAGVTATTMTLNCDARVGDATPGVGPDPTGVVAFFLNSISSNAFIGQCTLATLGGPGGLSGCPLITSAIPRQPATIWAVYYPNAASAYSGSVDSDDVTNVTAGPPDPTDTKIICVPTGPAGVAQPLDCQALVADDDGDPGPGAPSGTVAFFLNTISSSAFLAQCTLQPIPFTITGISRCGEPPPGIQTSPVGPGTVTIWGAYYPNTANYSGSVDSDTLTV
jgi:hypothetical protein